MARILAKIAALKTSNAALLGATLLAVALSFLADRAIGDWVTAHRREDWFSAAQCLSRYAAWPWLMLACASGAAVCLWQKKRAGLRTIVAAMICASLAGLLGDISHALTGRTRPNSGLAEGWFGPFRDGHWVILNTRYHAFPSAHTAAAAGLVAGIFLINRRLGLLLLPLPLSIAAARVYVGAHHFSDVVAGAAVGLGVAWWSHASFLRDRSSLPGTKV